MEAHDASKSKSNMMNFSGSAGDMLAAMEAAGIKAPDAADAALKVAEAPASSAPVNCEDPSCAVDHSHGNHSHHSCCETGECKHKTGASTIPAPPGGWPPPPPPPRLETAGSVIICNNDDEYNKAIERAGPERLVVVDCFADWCGPCRAIAPLFQRLATEHIDIVFVKVDVDACPRTARSLRVMAMPTFVFLKNGNRMGSFMGANEALLLRGIESDGKVGGICSSCVVQ